MDSSDQWSQFQKLLHQSKYIVFYTGAGISASAGIGTFTGEGAMGSLLHLREELLDMKMPTYAHHAITCLVNSDKAKFVVTSNHDNMHRKSGVPDEKLAELFGNAYIEVCLTCNKQYKRHVVCPPTGRYCDDSSCKGRLKKTGVRYGQATPEEPLTKGTEHSKLCDLAIVLGSSMNTGPFNKLPLYAKHFVLCNLSETSSDKQADFVFYENCDNFMKKIVNSFSDVQMKNFVYKQEFKVGMKQVANENSFEVYLTGTRTNEPCTCVSVVTIMYNNITKELDLNNLTKRFETEITCPIGGAVSFTINFHEAYECTSPMNAELTAANGAEKLLTFTKEVSYQ